MIKTTAGLIDVGRSQMLDLIKYFSFKVLVGSLISLTLIEPVHLYFGNISDIQSTESSNIQNCEVFVL